MAKTLKAPERLEVRFTEEQYERLRRAAKFRGRPMSTVVQDATLAELDVIEREIRLAEVARDKRTRHPVGLGLHSKGPFTKDPPPLRSTRAASGIRPAAKQEPIDREALIHYVLAGTSESERAVRRKTAADIVSGHAGAEAFLQVLDERLQAQKGGTSTRAPLGAA